MKSRDREGANDAAYLITFACYGAHLPGQAGTIDDGRNLFGSPRAKENKAKEAEARQKMRQEPYLLDAPRRAIVLDSLHEVCNHKAWTLLAAHVRSNHIHVVIGANETAERVMNTLEGIRQPRPECRRARQRRSQPMVAPRQHPPLVHT